MWPGAPSSMIPPVTQDQIGLIRALLEQHLVNLTGHLQAVQSMPELQAVADEGYEDIEHAILLTQSCLDLIPSPVA